MSTFLHPEFKCCSKHIQLFEGTKTQSVQLHRKHVNQLKTLAAMKQRRAKTSIRHQLTKESSGLGLSLSLRPDPPSCNFRGQQSHQPHWADDN